MEFQFPILDYWALAHLKEETEENDYWRPSWKNLIITIRTNFQRSTEDIANVIN